jgi:hypothetical protein
VASLAGNLELLSEKINAHSHGINSVAFSLDGTKIESCPHAMAGRSKSGILVLAEIAKSPLLPKLTPLGLRGITPVG